MIRLGDHITGKDDEIMKAQELFYPELIVNIGNYSFSEGIGIEVSSNKKVPYDWAKIHFTKEFRDNIILNSRDKVSILLGYNGTLEEVFSGNVTRSYNKAANENEIMIKDKMLLLEDVIITNTFMDVTPQEIVRYGLTKAGITEYKLSSTMYQAKKIVPIVQKNMVDVLKQINSIWGIDILSYFIKGIFYWGEKPDQDKIFQFEYANNIISLVRKSDLWELQSVALPFVQHSKKIKVIHPSISGVFEIERMSFTTNDSGFIRTKLYFKE